MKLNTVFINKGNVASSPQKYLATQEEIVETLSGLDFSDTKDSVIHFVLIKGEPNSRMKEIDDWAKTNDKVFSDSLELMNTEYKDKPMMLIRVHINFTRYNMLTKKNEDTNELRCEFFAFGKDR